MIRFLVDYRTKARPPEAFTAGQTVEGRSDASEMHFVSRRVAAFVGSDGTLRDAFGNVVPDAVEPAADGPETDDDGDDQDEGSDEQSGDASSTGDDPQPVGDGTVGEAPAAIAAPPSAPPAPAKPKAKRGTSAT